MLDVVRGVPDGKSDKSVIQSAEDAKLSSNYLGQNKPKEDKVVIGTKLDIYTPGTWN